MNGLLLDSDELRAAGRHLGEFLAAYQEGIASRPVFPVLDRTVIRRLLDEPLPAEGRSIEELFAELGADIIANSTQIAHPRFLAYVLASSTGVAPFAEAAAAALNQNCNLWTLSPAANAIEQKVISWFSELFAIQGGGGIITSGGSMANLSALVAARDSREPVVSRSEGLQGGGAPIVLYTSEEAHNSIDKAAALVGLGLNNVVRIPTDDRFRIRLDLLREAVAADRSAGRVSFCVVATAGTITTGAIDPLEELVAYCGEERLWLHVDGAYGAFAVFSSRVRDQLVAAGQADSLTLDPHKLLFMPLEAGCVLFRDPESWQDVFSFPSTYLSMPEEPDLLHYAEYGPQLSRGFKALKIWWSLRACGINAYTTAIDGVLDLAAYMGELVEAQPTLELLAPVTLTAVCFRVRNLDDAHNAEVLRVLLRDGLAFLGRARVGGRVCLRACFTNLRTTRADVDAIVEEVSRTAAGLE